MEDYYEWVASNVNMTWDELVAKAPYNAVTSPRNTERPLRAGYRGLSSDGSSPSASQAAPYARDIRTTRSSAASYGDTMMPRPPRPAPRCRQPPQYLPMPYFHDPDDRLEYGNDYRSCSPRPHPHHHGTLRNNPHIREIYPAPEVWISPVRRGARHCHRRLVNVKSPRTDGLDVFSNLKLTGLSCRRGSEPGQDGISVACRHRGIAKGSAYMERFWNPSF